MLRLRQCVAQHPDWTIAQTYVDRANANDLLHRTAWHQLQEDAGKHRFDAMLVFKLDRALRSVKNLHDTLAVWNAVPVGFLSAQEGFDTTTALDRLLLNLIASLATFELETIRERVAAGMERAKAEEKAIGRPKGMDPKKQARMDRVMPLLQSGALFWRQAAQKAGVALSTLQSYIKASDNRTEKFRRGPMRPRTGLGDPFLRCALYRQRSSF